MPTTEIWTKEELDTVLIKGKEEQARKKAIQRADDEDMKESLF